MPGFSAVSVDHKLTPREGVSWCFPVCGLLVASVPGARKVLVPGVGHLINLEAPATFDQELDSFLADLESW
jgi:pimeloyl-ACP methyl ester carboxylesterase